MFTLAVKTRVRVRALIRSLSFLSWHLLDVGAYVIYRKLRNIIFSGRFIEQTSYFRVNFFNTTKL